MTNKINGIDVSECCYFINHTPPKGQGDWCGAIHKGACKVYSKDCEYNKDCYFKQLKRLQEENEELKSRNANLRLNLATYDLPEVKKVLTDWRTGKLDKKFKKLQKENEKIKKQYNCYACGNCNGKEDYINLEKHYKGLRKQFDKLAPRNNTLSLRIEELENEKENLRQIISEVQNDRD